ncbi:hypothetical protein AX13_11485 [Comamonas aquatica DA1877]|uniref:Uncharacterized protein n=1 Tax=Comamonas aquatica DA1877 TaxID=1457173 RepID=A0A014MTP2_9BURK|nr:hypothetical protein AX13_11485 [Comamonas aquatica DA1877]
MLKRRTLRAFCALAPGSPVTEWHAHRTARSAQPEADLATIGAQILQ